MAAGVHSMTGFARTEGRLEAPTLLAWSWEIRSVNNKGLDARIRTPAGFESLDGPVRQVIGETVARGSVAATLSVFSDQDPNDVRINTGLLDRLLALVAEKAARLPAGVAPARFDGLLAVRGVIEIHQPMLAPDQAAARDDALIKGLKAALADLSRSRTQEGARLAPVIGSQLSTIADLIAKAAQLGATQPEAIRAKLTRAIAELTAGNTQMSPDRLAQEVALLAVKGDIREEIDRLTAHVAQARDLLAAGGPCGRRLDFLSQEFNREANTLCSKSQDVALTRIGLDLKAVIDQFREQIQNIE